jgi:hypothetical protein
MCLIILLYFLWGNKMTPTRATAVAKLANPLTTQVNKFLACYADLCVIQGYVTQIPTVVIFYRLFIDMAVCLFLLNMVS